MALESNEIPFLRLFGDDQDLTNLQNAMTRSAQQLRDYRENTARARDQSTQNQLQAFEPSNRILTKLMGGEQQFDLGGFQSPHNPEMFDQSYMMQGTATPQETAEQSAASLSHSLNEGRTAEAQSMNDQSAFWLSPAGPFGPLPMLAGMTPSATTNADMAAQERDITHNNAIKSAERDGYVYGKTDAPPWWNPSLMGEWDDGRRVQYTSSWYEMTPAEQLEVIKRGEESTYWRYDPNNPGHPLMLRAQEQGQLSDEERSRLLGE